MVMCMYTVDKRFWSILRTQLFKCAYVLSVLQIWMARSSGGALTSDLPTFSLSPQEYMTKVKNGSITFICTGKVMRDY